MKRLTQIFQALLGVAALIITVLVAAGRLAWRTFSSWWNKRPKWLRRSITAIAIIVPVGFAALVAYVFYEDEYGRDYWDRTLSENVTLQSFADNKWRVYNNQTEEYTTDKICWVSGTPEDNSLAVYALPGKRGYVDVNTGRIVIDAKANDYRKAWVFSEELAAVMKDGKIGFINSQNKVVIPFQFDYSDKCRMWNFGYLFHDGYCIMTNADGDLGLIDKSGNWVVEPAYDEIWSPHTSGYRIIVNDSNYGVLDSTGAIVYPVEFGHITILTDGFVLTKSGKQWQVDFDGNTIQPFMYDNAYYLKYPIGYNECGDIEYAFADFVKYEVANSYGIMNRITGKPITPAIYEDVNRISKESFEVQDCDSYDWYLLDANGNVVSKK